MPKSLVHRKTAAALDRAREQITLRLLVSNAKRTVAELAAAERRLLSIRNEILGRAWQLGKLLPAIKERVGHGRGWSAFIL